MDRLTYTKPRKKRRTAPKRKVQVTVSCLYCNKSFLKSHLEIGVIRTKICCGTIFENENSKTRTYEIDRTSTAAAIETTSHTTRLRGGRWMFAFIFNYY